MNLEQALYEKYSVGAATPGWDENKHPRSKDGKFGKKDGGSNIDGKFDKYEAGDNTKRGLDKTIKDLKHAKGIKGWQDKKNQDKIQESTDDYIARAKGIKGKAHRELHKQRMDGIRKAGKGFKAMQDNPGGEKTFKQRKQDELDWHSRQSEKDAAESTDQQILDRIGDLDSDRMDALDWHGENDTVDKDQARTLMAQMDAYVMEADERGLKIPSEDLSTYKREDTEEDEYDRNKEAMLLESHARTGTLHKLKESDLPSFKHKSRGASLTDRLKQKWSQGAATDQDNYMPDENYADSLASMNEDNLPEDNSDTAMQEQESGMLNDALGSEDDEYDPNETLATESQKSMAAEDKTDPDYKKIFEDDMPEEGDPNEIVAAMSHKQSMAAEDEDIVSKPDNFLEEEAMAADTDLEEDEVPEEEPGNEVMSEIDAAVPDDDTDEDTVEEIEDGLAAHWDGMGAATPGWDESKHTRGDGGKFSSKKGSMKKHLASKIGDHTSKRNKMTAKALRTNDSTSSERYGEVSNIHNQLRDSTINEARNLKNKIKKKTGIAPDQKDPSKGFQAMQKRAGQMNSMRKGLEGYAKRGEKILANRKAAKGASTSDKLYEHWQRG